jgi:hypothetical protein
MASRCKLGVVRDNPTKPSDSKESFHHDKDMSRSATMVTAWAGLGCMVRPDISWRSQYGRAELTICTSRASRGCMAQTYTSSLHVNQVSFELCTLEQVWNSGTDIVLLHYNILFEDFIIPPTLCNSNFMIEVKCSMKISLRSTRPSDGSLLRLIRARNTSPDRARCADLWPLFTLHCISSATFAGHRRMRD